MASPKMASPKMATLFKFFHGVNLKNSVPAMQVPLAMPVKPELQALAKELTANTTPVKRELQALAKEFTANPKSAAEH